ncbi:enoyl-CoA hydratase/isomerase family protein [Phenylobacterium sp.]|jgi:enoyl-CoA hydratase|uniref:enoyl-CoA hydratase/isomerase family protein n=1 Tax=Phenylobacterium sp. TaxID=1871053 RepID=UPI002E37D277|nr:enoyl-CoA hydratase/isomerase family protein [Phenylobacterium sp.]HEX2560418.1 enoyl-CoA hydratase/isomerase family protein [Phenylobacterium sp.]
MDPEVLIRTEGQVGRITLNRPQALHALTTAMCLEMIEALSAWRADPAIVLVMIDHAGERGFCAGGDIRALVDSLAESGKAAEAFFFTEYQLDHLIFSYPKPVLAIMDGVVMGGGAGISLPAAFRVATERTRFAMPETGIGLFPDVGACWRLSRMPDHAGAWLALTGARIGPADCELLGVVTDFVEAAKLEAFKAAVLAEPVKVETILTEFEGEAGRPAFAAHQDAIRRLFGAPSLEALVAGLAADRSDWAREQLEIIRSKSPLSTAVAFRQLQAAAGIDDFAQLMEMEYRIALRLIRRPDFSEGVRAVILDKDQQPRWSPSSLAEVTVAMIDEVFAPLPPEKAWTPLP